MQRVNHPRIKNIELVMSAKDASLSSKKQGL